MIPNTKYSVIVTTFYLYFVNNVSNKVLKFNLPDEFNNISHLSYINLLSTNDYFLLVDSKGSVYKYMIDTFL